MLRFMFGVFIILHGLVHLLYFGHSQKFFELQPGMTWPAGAWAFSRLFGNAATRNLASISLILTAIALVVGGMGTLLRQDWWRAAVVGGAVLSTFIYFLLWNGKLQRLDNQGGIGILINLAILAAVLLLGWPGSER